MCMFESPNHNVYQLHKSIIFYQMKKEKPRPKEVYLQRIKCPCMAQKHELINNCLGCGKVVCAQEGEGNCLYCGKLVTRPDGLFIDDSEKLFPSLSKQQQKNVAMERSKAIQHKNQLVERDKSSTQNQNIFDEQVDYYEISETNLRISLYLNIRLVIRLLFSGYYFILKFIQPCLMSCQFGINKQFWDYLPVRSSVPVLEGKLKYFRLFVLSSQSHPF